jgi:hypothetical protein
MGGTVVCRRKAMCSVQPSGLVSPSASISKLPFVSRLSAVGGGLSETVTACVVESVPKLFVTVSVTW